MIFPVTELEHQCRCTVHTNPRALYTDGGNDASAPQSLLRELDWDDFEGGFSRHFLSKAESYEKM